MKPVLSRELKRIFEQSPFIVDMGLQADALGPGVCTTVLPLQPRHFQQDGCVHAGVLATVADHTAGAAAATLLQEGQIVLTAEFKINLLHAARGERLICRAKVLKPGKHLTVVESEIFSDSAGVEKLVSKATVTIAVVTVEKG